ncbi:MAG: hypothetical protein R2839_12390 [Thermomicrobiales bacterium]
MADATGAWILETAGHRWVAQAVRERGAISNLLTIGPHWDIGSPGVREHAENRRWWHGEGDLRRPIRIRTPISPRAFCRLERARKILGGYAPGVGIAEMMDAARPQ